MQRFHYIPSKGNGNTGPLEELDTLVDGDLANGEQLRLLGSLKLSSPQPALIV